MNSFNIEIDVGGRDVLVPMLFVPLLTADWITLMVEHVGFAAWAEQAQA